MQCNTLKVNFTHSIGVIDGKIHPIQWPHVEDQAPFYDGHHHTHCLSRGLSMQIITDCNFCIRFVKCDLLGNLNDAGQFLLLPIGWSEGWTGADQRGEYQFSYHSYGLLIAKVAFIICDITSLMYKKMDLVFFHH